LDGSFHDHLLKFLKAVVEVLTTKIGLAVAWAQVYGATVRLVLKGRSGFAQDFLTATLRVEIGHLGGCLRDSRWCKESALRCRAMIDEYDPAVLLTARERTQDYGLRHGTLDEQAGIKCHF
jgi:hypothetical protein